MCDTSGLTTDLGQTLLVGLANAGSVLVKGKGRLTAFTPGGRRALDQSFALDTFVPHTSIQFPVYVRGQRLPPGRYRAEVTVTYGNHHRLQRTFEFTISSSQVRQTYGTTAPSSFGGGSGSGSSMPVWALALGAVALLAAGVGGSSLFFRRRTASA